MSAKRKNTSGVFTLRERLEILKKLEKNVSVTQLAEEYKVTPRTIRHIRAKGTMIHHQMESQSVNPEARRLRQPVLKELEAQLLTWFMEQRAIGYSINDVLLQEKANEINKEIGGPSSFKASKGWIWRFKNRRNIRLLDSHRNSSDTDTQAATEFATSFQERIEEENIKLENIYNMCETGLMWKALPQRLMIRVDEGNKIFGKKIKKDRIAVALCANVTGGNKLPALFVHKFENPRALKHCRDSLPVIFQSQKYAWVDTRILINWIHNDFKPRAKQYQLEQGIFGKIILLLANFSVHNMPETIQMDDDNIEIIFLPPKITSLLQPMDQGIIEEFKRSYRLRMLRRILKFSGNVTQFYVDYDIKDCMNLVKESWDNITNENITNAWKKLLVHNLPQQLRTVTENEGNNLLMNIGETIAQITQEDIPQEQVKEWLLMCKGSEKLRKDSETMKCEDQDETTSSLNKESSILEFDEEEIERSFNTLILWSRNRPDIVKLHANILKEYYNLDEQ
ncbi:jerky protein homolog-like [Prorops nasuta]|uniref:jerky protein homolog-like n=1 Tax=Prorops nasuta TaxID=863751 RepID=UPI0034CD1C4C